MTELKNYRKKLEIAEAEIAKLKNKPIDVDLGGGKFLLYGSEYNNKVKFGFIFCHRFCCLFIKREFSRT